jgi:hypothetical protein
MKLTITLQIIHLVIENFEIRSDMNFEIVQINDIDYEKLLNLLVHESIIKNYFKIKKLILYLLNKRFQFIAVK